MPRQSDLQKSCQYNPKVICECKPRADNQPDSRSFAANNDAYRSNQLPRSVSDDANAVSFSQRNQENMSHSSHRSCETNKSKRIPQSALPHWEPTLYSIHETAGYGRMSEEKSYLNGQTKGDDQLYRCRSEADYGNSNWVVAEDQSFRSQAGAQSTFKEFHDQDVIQCIEELVEQTCILKARFMEMIQHYQSRNCACPSNVCHCENKPGAPCVCTTGPSFFGRRSGGGSGQPSMVTNRAQSMTPSTRATMAPYMEESTRATIDPNYRQSVPLNVKESRGTTINSYQRQITQQAVEPPIGQNAEDSCEPQKRCHTVQTITPRERFVSYSVAPNHGIIAPTKGQSYATAVESIRAPSIAPSSAQSIAPSEYQSMPMTRVPTGARSMAASLAPSISPSVAPTKASIAPSRESAGVESIPPAKTNYRTLSNTELPHLQSETVLQKCSIAGFDEKMTRIQDEIIALKNQLNVLLPRSCPCRNDDPNYKEISTQLTEKESQINNILSRVSDD